MGGLTIQATLKSINEEDSDGEEQDDGNEAVEASALQKGVGLPIGNKPG